MRVPFNGSQYFGGRKGVGGLVGAGLAALLVVVAPAAVTPARAQTATAPQPTAGQLAAAKELVAANGEGESFNSLIRGIIEQAAASFAQANPDLIRDLREVANGLIPQYESRRAEVDDILAKAYASQFTEAELKEMLAFYNTPTGKKLVTNRQALLDQGMRGVQAWGASFAKEMEGRVREEMKKRGFTI